MIELIGKYKSVLRFILTFIGAYFLLSLIYGFFLDFSTSPIYYPDFITFQVAQQCEWFINILDYDVAIQPHPQEAAMKLMVEDRFMARVVEGCNSVSVIILFWAFVLSFFDGWKKTLFFMLVGAVGIYVINILRIVFLVLAIYHYPEYTEFLHTIIFPAIIYGFVFLLWIYWISLFKKEAHGDNL